MKDIVIFLSNVADQIFMPSKGDALCLLHFLLAFSPTFDTYSEELTFTFYNPRINRYYPPAIDSFAKLLLRYEPNRAYFKSVFADKFQSALSLDTSQSQHNLPAHQIYPLLTRSFAFSIAVLPDRTRLQLPDDHLAQVREPTLSQGLLAADVIASLLPMQEPVLAAALARDWLGSHDSWVSSLMYLCRCIFDDPKIRSHEAWRAITNRALGMLKVLGTVGLGRSKERQGASTGTKDEGLSEDIRMESQNGDSTSNADADLAVSVPIKSLEDGEHPLDDDAMLEIDAAVMPNWTFVIGALNMSNMDNTVLENLVALANLER